MNKTKEPKKSKTRSDIWSNTITYLGIRGKDRTQSNVFTKDNSLTMDELETLYRNDGFARRIIDFISSEMVREWFTIEGDTDDRIMKYLKTLDAKNSMSDLVTWSRLFGGAIIIIGADDGGELSEPLNERAIRSVDFLHVFDRTQIDWNESDLYTDPTNPKYGSPEIYRITPTSNQNIFSVHETRVLRLNGERIPIRTSDTNNGWGDSALQSIYTQLKNLGASYGIVANIMEDFIQTVLKIDNLQEILENGDEDLIRKRLDIIDTSRHVSNTILMDAREDYEKQSSSVAGLDALVDRFALALSGATGIPYTFLMGRPPSGLQASGDADIRMFYDMIKSRQEDQLQPLLERLISVILSASNSPSNLSINDITIEFVPLWQMDEMEQAQHRKTVAEADAIYLDRGVVSSGEVAISRFGGSAYSPETSIDEERERILTDDE